jgi:hypothetical protein
VVQERRRERLRRQCLSAVASATALSLVLGLMAIADTGPLARPERTVDFGAGAHGDHQGNGTDVLSTPSGRTPPAQPGPATSPVSALIVAVRRVVDVAGISSTGPTTTTLAPAPTSTTVPPAPTSTTTTTVEVATKRHHSHTWHHAHKPHTPHRSHHPHAPKIKHKKRPEPIEGPRERQERKAKKREK